MRVRGIFSPKKQSMVKLLKQALLHALLGRIQLLHKLLVWKFRQKANMQCERLLHGADLGLVDYIFSDKTGTLTSNEMQLRLIAIKQGSFGSVDFK